MVRPVPKEVEELEGVIVTCPLCREEEVELSTTKNDSLQGFCAIQRSPFFLNEPKRIDDELLPDQEESEEEAEEDASEDGAEVAQEEPGEEDTHNWLQT